MSEQIRILSRSMAVVAALMFVSSSALAISNYTETFASGNAGWTNNSGAAAGWSSTGGYGGTGGAEVSMDYPFTPLFGSSGPIILRAVGSGASGGAFVGDWSNVTSLSIDVKHDGPGVLDFYMRLATPAGFPGGIFPYFGAPVVPNTWTTLSWNPNGAGACIDEGAPGSTCPGTIANVGQLQFGTGLGSSYPDPTTVNFAFDNVNVVPEPGTASMLFLGMGGLGLWGRRNRRDV